MRVELIQKKATDSRVDGFFFFGGGEIHDGLVAEK